MGECARVYMKEGNTESVFPSHHVDPRDQPLFAQTLADSFLHSSLAVHLSLLP